MSLRLNRNVITDADAVNVRLALRGDRSRMPRTLRQNPPAVALRKVAAPHLVAAGVPVGGQPPDDPSAPAGNGNPNADPPNGPVAADAESGGDDYLTRLVKFVPPEIIGAYLAMAGVVQTNVTGPHDRALWLGTLLLAMVIITPIYDVRVLNVVRTSQIAVSLVGLAVYVFATGGWFATTTWYEPWYAGIVLPLFALLVGVLQLKPLPDEK